MVDVAVIIGSSSDGTLARSDRAALSMGRSMSPRGVKALVRPGDLAAARYAAAAGAVDVIALSNPLEQTEFRADVVIIGLGGAGEDGDLLAATLAERLGAALLLDVIAASENERGLSVMRDLGRGACDVWTVTGPAVLVMAAEPAAPPYVSRYRIQSARIAPRVLATIAEKEAAVAWEPARPRAKSTGGARGDSATDRLNDLFGAAPSAVAPADSETIIRADAKTCARHLVRYLRHHGFVEAGERVLEPSPLGRGQGEGSALSDTIVTRKSPSAGALTPTLSQRERGPDASVSRLRVPRPLDGSTRGLARRPIAIRAAIAPALDPRIARGPRGMSALSTQAPAMLRRPRPVAPASSSSSPVALITGKLARAPRRVGAAPTAALTRRPRPLS